MSNLQKTASSESDLPQVEAHRPLVTPVARDYAAGSAVRWSSLALAPVIVFNSLATNTAIVYNVHVDSGHTNPVISLDQEEADWLDEESGEVAEFLSFLDAQIEADPDSIVPADEEQLDRIAKLLVEVDA